MRIRCYNCGKSVSSELPNESVVRAIVFCPECVEGGSEEAFDIWLKSILFRKGKNQ
jgi:hypothetical protein